MPTFFVCYRREDAGYAAALSNALAQRHGPGRVFKDITSLRPADDWRAEVAAAIGRSTFVLALIGQNWMAGVDPRGLRHGRPDPIVFELAEAFRTGRTVVPVLLGGQRMPPAHHLPLPLQRLSELNAAYVRTESADADIAALVDRLPQPPRPPAPHPSAPYPAPHPSAPRPLAAAPARKPRRGCIVVIAVVAVSGVVLGGLGGVSSLFGPGSGSDASPPPPATAAGPPSVASSATGGADTKTGGAPATTNPTLQIDPKRGPSGTVIRATATGFTPGETVQFLFQGRPLDEATVDGNGRATGSFAAPEGPTGTWTVTAVQQRSVLYDDALFTLTG